MGGSLDHGRLCSIFEDSTDILGGGDALGGHKVPSVGNDFERAIAYNVGIVGAQPVEQRAKERAQRMRCKHRQVLVIHLLRTPPKKNFFLYFKKKYLDQGKATFEKAHGRRRSPVFPLVHKTEDGADDGAVE